MQRRPMSDSADNASTGEMVVEPVSGDRVAVTVKKKDGPVTDFIRRQSTMDTLRSPAWGRAAETPAAAQH